MGKGSDSPDVVGAAETEGAYSRETARDVTYADRPDQFNPLGSVEWGTTRVRDPATGQMVTKWTQNQTLNKELQSSLDNSLGYMRDKGDLATGMMGRVREEMSGAPDWDQFGDVIGFDPDARRQAAEDASYGKSTSRMDPRYAKQEQALEIRLRGQGLRPGDQAYDAQMQTFGQEKTDAYGQARYDSVSAGRDEYGISLEGNTRANALRNQQIQEMIAKRGYSLSEAEALMAGQETGDIAGIVTGGGG